MHALGAVLTGIRRRPIGIAVLLVVSMAFAAAAVTSRAAVLDAEARAELTAESDRITGEIDVVTERTEADRAAAAASDECVRAETGVLQPAVEASARFSATAVAMGTAAVTRAVPASDGDRAAVTESVVLVRAADAAGRDALIAQVGDLTELRASVGEAAENARAAAVERHAACEAARRAVAAFLAEVGPRTEKVIAASGMAPADVVATLRAARDEVLAGEEGSGGLAALPTWLAAASEVESSHATANAAAIEAAARAAAAAEPESPDIFPPDWRTVPPIELGLSEEMIRACQPDCDPYGTGGTTPPPGWEMP